MTMKTLAFALLAGLVVLSVAETGRADQMPEGARPASAEEVARAYAGKSDLWEKDCSGGIYYARNWQARAWCAEKSEALGAGEWSVDDEGRMCQSLTWYWPNGTRVGATRDARFCISHVMDEGGDMWRSWPDDPEWWPMKKPTGPVSGYVFQDDVQQTRTDLGI
ncbi:MAG: DUF995 domain-containing protein [Rhodobacter sp.]|nr:DUF995 domain-containing protein [Rhodobacter sp.]